MKKSLFLLSGILMILIFLFVRCVQEPKTFEILATVYGLDGEVASFASVKVGNTGLKADVDGTVRTKVSPGKVKFSAFEAGSQLVSKEVVIDSNRAIRLDLDQTTDTYGFIYRKIEGNLKATYVIPLAIAPLAAVYEGESGLQAQEAGKGHFLFTQEIGDKTRIEWSPLLEGESKHGLYYAFSISVDGEIEGQVRIFQGTDRSVGDLPEIPLTDEERVILPNSALMAVGDVVAPFGRVDVYDLIDFLTNWKGAYQAKYDLGSLFTMDFARPNNTSNPQPFNASTLVKDSMVNVYDLLVLLNAYKLSTSEISGFTNINKPFPVKNLNAVLTGSGYNVTWSPEFPNDVHEQFRLYGIDSPTHFSTSAPALATVSKSITQILVSTPKPYIALCAVNTSPGQPDAYYSAPTFFALPGSADRFKLANSWGIAGVGGADRWEKVPDGFLYMTFDAAKAVNLEAWFYRPRSGYHPLAVAVIGMTHPVRNDTAVFLGVGNPSSPRIEKKVYGIRSYGGPFNSAGGPYPYPDNRIVVDITEFLPLNGESVYLRVYDSNGSTQTGTILYFSVETYVSYPTTLLSRYTSTQTPMPTRNGGSVSISTPAISFSPIAPRQTDQIREMLHKASDPLTMENISPSMVRKDNDLNRAVDEMGTGLLHPTEEQWQDIVERGFVRIVDSNRLVELVGRDQLRGGVDHSLSPYFPPIGNQGYKGSCVSFSTGYYIATFYLAREFGWDLSGATWSGAWPGAPSAAYRNRIMSPDFLFLQLYEYDAFTEAPDWGSYYVDNIVALSRIGISSWLQLPYLGSYPTNLSEYQGWPGEEAWRQAPLYRMDSPAPAQEVAWYLQVKNDTDIQALQALLDLGILISVSVDAFQYKNLSDEDLWDVNNYTKPEQGNHANTIVGYR